MKELTKKIIKKLIREWKNRKNILFYANRDFHRLLISHSKNPRPSSYPYISGDTFRSLAQHIFDEVSTINPEKVRDSDIIFVVTHFIEKFFNEMHPLIKAKYVLITHNSDNHITLDLVKYIDDKIIRWYGQNVLIIHPKITPVPIGLENLYYYTNGNISIIKKEQRRKVLKKKNKILFGFSVSTNPPERQRALDILAKTKTAEKISGWPNTWGYLKKLNSYKFVVAPPGNGIDSPREWQAMYLGVIPIVKDSILTRYYSDIGLPVFIVKDWDELLTLDEKKLQNIYEKIFPKFASPALYFDYWHAIITNHD